MMAAKRLTKATQAVAFGVFQPVGHLVLAFDDDAAAHEAAQALREIGLEDEDILEYTASEESAQMQRMLDGVPGSAGFGYEVSLMRQYKALADQGCGWLIVYAPDDAQCEKVMEVARQHDAKLAERYHSLAVEDLL